MAGTPASVVTKTNDNFIGVSASAGGAPITDSGTGLAMNFGTEVTPPTAEKVYADAGDLGTGLPLRAWGPSSQHAGGVTLHVYADAHAQAITREIDPSAYLRFITRNDGDPSKIEGIE